MYLNNNFKTKLILRISGKPKLNFFRSILWKISNKNVSLVFCPTIETMNYLKRKNIFDEHKLKFLPDPILFKEEIKKLKKVNDKSKLINHSFFLSIGRLTKQKNHELLINLYKKYRIKEKLVIIGDGELKDYLLKLIGKFNLKKKIFILNYKKNIFYYIKKAKAVIIPSLWEDPGFVMIESAYLRKIVICSDCPSGPKEVLSKLNCGYLAEIGNIADIKNGILNGLNNKIRIANYNKFLKNYHISYIIKKYINVFEKTK